MKRSTAHSPNPIGTEIIDAAMTKWPSLPSRTLAQKIYKENPSVFRNLDCVRGAIRYRRGTTGAGHRTALAKADKRPPEPAPSNPLGLPTSDEIAYKPFIIDVAKTTNALVLSDIHIPYHSISALSCAIEDGKRSECKIVLLNGDTVDCYQLSRFLKDPRRRDFKGEIEATKLFLTVHRKAFPDAEIIWKDGNHDERLALYVAEKVPEIAKLGLIGWPAILGFADRGIAYVTDKRPVKLGKLTVMHGHEFPTGIAAPVNAARGLYLRAKSSAMAGHWHQTSEHSEPTINEELVTCWSTGCLAELHPAYMPINKHNHGHATVTIYPSGDYSVQNKRIKNGKIF